MLIRLARHSDVDTIRDLLIHLNNFGWRPEKRTVEEAVRHPATFMYVAEESEVLVGTATLSVRALPSVGFVGHIDDVVVLPTCRGQGVAKELLDEIINACRQLHCVSLELTSRPERKAANQFYRKMGFKVRATNVYRLII